MGGTPVASFATNGEGKCNLRFLPRLARCIGAAKRCLQVSGRYIELAAICNRWFRRGTGCRSQFNGRFWRILGPIRGLRQASVDLRPLPAVARLGAYVVQLSGCGKRRRVPAIGVSTMMVCVFGSTFHPLTIRVQAAHQDRQAATKSLGNLFPVGERRESCRRQAGHDLAAVAPTIGRVVGSGEAEIEPAIEINGTNGGHCTYINCRACCATNALYDSRSNCPALAYVDTDRQACK